MRGAISSSTFIREEIAAGNMEKLRKLCLNMPISYRERLCMETRSAERSGFRRSNLLPPQEKLLPPFGVYAARVEIDGK